MTMTPRNLTHGQNGYFAVNLDFGRGHCRNFDHLTMVILKFWSLGLLSWIIEYEIIGEGSQISTNQKPGNSAFSLLIG